jgi:hypothetical protein
MLLAGRHDTAPLKEPSVERGIGTAFIRIVMTEQS